MTFLKPGGTFGAYSWVTLSSDCRFELQWSELRKSLHCSTVYLTFAVIETFNKKSLEKVLLSFDEFEARTLVWKRNARVNDMFRYDCGEGFQGSLIKTVVQLGNGSTE